MQSADPRRGAGLGRGCRLRTQCQVSSKQISVAVGRADGGTWRGRNRGDRPYGGPHGWGGLAETEVEENRGDCELASAGRQAVKRNKKQHRAFLIPLCILALLQVTLIKLFRGNLSEFSQVSPCYTA